jgi:hypothetical protein
MHVLHRPHHLHRALLEAVAAAALAIVLTLAIAGGLNDLGSTAAPASAPAPYTAAPAPTLGFRTGDPFTHGSFRSPFIAPPPPSWAPAG